MAPLLVTALVGIGVKIVTDLLMGGAKQVTGPAAPEKSFSAALDKARAGTGAVGATAASGTPAVPGAGLADRSRLLAVDMSGGLPPAARTQGFAAYRRIEEPVQAV